MHNLSIPGDLLVGKSYQTRRDLWHLPRDVHDKIDARRPSEGVTVAILDTGIIDHPDLPKPIATRSFIRGESVEDRQNGHGPHCAGTAVGRNQLSPAGHANLIAGKVLSSRNGSGGSDGIAQAVRWAIEEGADVISLSLGGGGFYGPLSEAFKYAWKHGVYIVAAAGNSGFNGVQNTIDFPGSDANSLCIGATREDGSIAGFSSGGKQLDIACPGQNIISCGLRGDYVSMSGTSMATPFAAGLLACVIGLQRREGGAQFNAINALRAYLSKYTVDAGKPGKDGSFGYGIPMAGKLVESLTADDITLI